MTRLVRRWWPVATAGYIALIFGLTIAVAFQDGGSPSAASSTDGGPVAQWDFSSRFGSRVVDAAGENDGIVHHASWTTSSKYFSNSVLLQLDGERTYMEIPPARSLNFGDAFTVAAWVRSSSNNERQVLLYKDDPDGDFRSAPVKVYVPWGQGRLGVVLSDGQKRVGFLSDESIRPRQWHHIAITYNDQTGQIRYFIDGEDAGQDTTSWRPRPLRSPIYLGMGRDNDGTYFPFEGELESAMLFDRALSTVEVENLFRREDMN